MGCFTQLQIYDGAPIHEEQLSKIQEGVSTKTDILKQFGSPVAFQEKKSVLNVAAHRYFPPIHKAKMNPERIFTYRYQVSSGFNFFLFFWVYTYVKTREDYLMVFFDEQDKVTHYSFAKDIPE